MDDILIISYKVLTCLIILKTGYYLFNMIQQSHYSVNKIKYHLAYYYFKIPVVTITLLGLFLVEFNFYLTLLLFAFSFSFLFMLEHYIIKIKFTKRMIRLITTSALIIIIFLFINHNIRMYLLIVLLLPLIIFISIYINYIPDYFINRYYEKRLVNQLNETKAIKIAVTGSYGKTSTKDIIYELLKDRYITVKTPFSYNTVGGICKYINSISLSCIDIIIFELGASKTGDIKKLCSLINPTIGVITAIGPQHLETFKSMDNILKEKWELALSLRSSDTLILNYDNEYLYGLKSECNIISVGSTNYCNVYFKDKIYDRYTNFTIVDGHKNIPLKTQLNGDHSIINILLSYGVIKALAKQNINISIEEFSEKISELTNTKNRLSTYYVDKLKVFDDSYNCNIDGIKTATSFVLKQDGLKIIITPGIVECGKYRQAIINEFYKTIKRFDVIYLINCQFTKQMKPLINDKNVIYKTSFKEAYNDVLSKYKSQSSNLLIASDLPDCYIKR